MLIDFCVIFLYLCVYKLYFVNHIAININYYHSSAGLINIKKKIIILWTLYIKKLKNGVNSLSKLWISTFLFGKRIYIYTELFSQFVFICQTNIKTFLMNRLLNLYLLNFDKNVKNENSGHTMQPRA